MVMIDPGHIVQIGGRLTNGSWVYNPNFNIKDYSAKKAIESTDNNSFISQVVLYSECDVVKVRNLENQIVCENAYHDSLYLSRDLALITRILDLKIPKHISRDKLNAELTDISNLEKTLERELSNYRSNN